MFSRLGSAAILTLAITGCLNNATRGSGKTATETREVSGFSAVQLGWLGDLAITQGNTEGLTIEAEDNILPLISTRVDGGILIIELVDSASEGAVIPTQSVKYNLQVKDLKSIDLSGAGNISAPALESEKLRLTLGGAGKVDLKQVKTQELEATSSGAGSLTLEGIADSQSVNMSGLGNYSAEDLQSNDAVVAISGAGNATVWTAKTLDVNISGAGSVSYYGSPEVTQSISGVGSVKSLGNK